MKTFTKLRSTFTILSALALLAGVPTADATNYTWSGSSNVNISKNTNWNPSLTAFSSSDLAIWDSATYTNSPWVNVNISIGELLFGSNNTGGVTFGSDGTGASNGIISLSGIAGIGIQMNNNSGAVNLGSSARFSLGASQIWINNSTNSLTINNTITGADNITARTLTIDGTGNTSLGGVISNGGAVGTTALTKNGSATLTLSATNTYTGATTVNAGTLSLTGTVASTSVAVNGGALRAL